MVVLQFAWENDKLDVEFVLQAVQKSGGAAFQFAAKELHRNFKVASKAVELDPMNLQYVKPEKTPNPGPKGSDSLANKMQYKELALKAVKQDGLAYQYVKKDYLPPDSIGEIATEAVKQDGMALEFDKQKLLPLCKLAVARTWTAIEHVPQQHVKPKKDSRFCGGMRRTGSEILAGVGEGKGCCQGCGSCRRYYAAIRERAVEGGQ